MTPTKKQIAEVTALATSRGLNVEKALKLFDNCSASIYKAIGAEGLLESFVEVEEIKRADKLEGISFNLCQVLKVTEKAFYLSFNHPTSLKTVEKWIAKSIIKDDVIPFWAVK